MIKPIIRLLLTHYQLVNTCIKASLALDAKKPIHFIGISGVGMSALASWCLQEGWTVQGSTHSPNALSDSLARQGATIYPYHDAAHISESLGGVVYSTDIPPHHQERIQATELHVPLWHRSDFLRAVVSPYRVMAISGSHGKTSTTSLLGHLLATADLDPLIAAGGHMNALNTSCRAGRGGWAVVEADESDGSHLNFSALHSAILTNIGHDHLWRYGHSTEQLTQSFQSYLRLAEQWAIVCRDSVSPSVIPSDMAATVVWYGQSPTSDYQAVNIRPSHQGIQWDCHTPQGLWTDLTMPLYGQHNVLNALACVASGVQCGLDLATLRRGLASFQGVDRRMTRIGYRHGVPLMDDYAQHPTAIATVLKALKDHEYKRVLAICQPHRYHRLRTLFQDYAQAFQHASSVVILPVYSAGEPPCPQGTSSAMLVDTMRQTHRHPSVHLGSAETLASHLEAEPWDMAVFLGAGDITRLARASLTHDIHGTPLIG